MIKNHKANGDSEALISMSKNGSQRGSGSLGFDGGWYDKTNVFWCGKNLAPQLSSPNVYDKVLTVQTFRHKILTETSL